MKLSQLAPYQIVMLIGGVVLFLFALGFLVFLTAKDRSTKPAFAMLPLAILMIGFPAMKGFEGFGVKFEMVAVVETKARAVEENPGDVSAKRELESALSKLETKVSPEKATMEVAEAIAHGHVALGNFDRGINWANIALTKAPNSQTARILLDRAKVDKLLPPNTTAPLPPPARSNLTAAVTDLSKHQDLTPAARVTLAKGQLALGQTNAAAANLHQATKLNPRLTIEPQLKPLLNPR